MSKPAKIKPKYKESRKLLAILSNKDGPWVPVRRLRRIEVDGGSKEDVIRIHFTGHSLATDPDPVYVRGGRTKELHFPRGQVRVERVSGKAQLTIMAVCERLSDGTQSVRKRGLNQHY